MNFLLCYLHLSYLVWQESTNCIPTKIRASCSSSSSSSDYGSRGPKFDSHWEVDFFLFSFIFLNQWCMLNQAPRGGTSDFSTFQERNGALVCLTRQDRINCQRPKTKPSLLLLPPALQVPGPLLLPLLQLLPGRLLSPPAGVDPRLDQLVLDDDVLDQRFPDLEMSR